MSGFFGGWSTNFQFMFAFYIPFLLVGGVLMYFKKYLVAGLLLSTSANFIFYLDSGNYFYQDYNLLWFQYFFRNIWPILNIGLFLYILWSVYKRYLKK